MFYTVHPNSLTVHKIGKKEPLHSPIMSHPPPERSWSERIPWRTTAQRPGLAHSWWAASTPAPGHGGHGCHGSPPSSCHWELPRAAAGPRSGQRPQGRSRGGREDIATPWRGRSGLVFLFWRTIWLWCFFEDSMSFTIIGLSSSGLKMSKIRNIDVYIYIYIIVYVHIVHCPLIFLSWILQLCALTFNTWAQLWAMMELFNVTCHWIRWSSSRSLPGVEPTGV